MATMTMTTTAATTGANTMTTTDTMAGDDDTALSLSGDGRRLVFASSRTGRLGGTDICMSTRTRLGR